MSTPAPLWAPSADRVAETELDRFRVAFASAMGMQIADSVELHRVSLQHPEAFWSFAWQRLGLHGDPGSVALDPGDGTLERHCFFPEASLSFAEQLLWPPGAMPSDLAIIEVGEDGSERLFSRAELATAVHATSAALAARGVGRGDVVAAYMPNVSETVVAMLATVKLGGTFTSASSEFGAAGVVDRFNQVAPKVLVAATGYAYGGKAVDRREEVAAVAEGLSSLRCVVVVGEGLDPSTIGAEVVAWQDLVAERAGSPEFPRFGFNDAGFVLYSSGTTGKPKAIVHRAGGLLLKHRVEHALHCDVRSGDAVAYFTTCGWMMWNWLVSALAAPATVLLYDGNPFHPGPARLLDLVDRHRLTLLGISPRYLASLRQAGVAPVQTHDLSSLRTICSTGSPLTEEGFRYVYESIKADVHLASISGGTDLCGCLVAGDPTKPVVPGELQAPALGLDVDVVDGAGNRLRGERGELACMNAFPSMPLGFVGDDGSRYHQAYFSQIPGAWAQGDFATRTSSGGFVIHGRSDATLNASGVRVGTAELYRALEAVAGIVDAVAVGREVDGDTEVWLFVVLAEGCELDEKLRREVARVIRQDLSPRHVPAQLVAVSAVPRTRSAKVAELAVADVVNGRALRSTEGLENPEVLEEYARLAAELA